MAKKQPDPDEDVKMVLDAMSFTSPERMECQTRFNTPFGDLLSAVFEAINPTRDGPSVIDVVDGDGNRCFPDQIIQYMLWVQTKRERPDVDISEFDDLTIGDLHSAYIRGRMGKEKSSGQPKKP